MSDTKKLDDLMEALNCRDLFINPDILRLSADEIDCAGSCENCWHEYDTNASGCHKSERGEYCPNDVAETLRALASVAEGKRPAVNVDDDAMAALREAYTALAFAFRRLESSPRARDGELCRDFSKVRGKIERVLAKAAPSPTTPTRG